MIEWKPIWTCSLNQIGQNHFPQSATVHFVVDVDCRFDSWSKRRSGSPLGKRTPADDLAVDFDDDYRIFVRACAHGNQVSRSASDSGSIW